MRSETLHLNESENVYISKAYSIKRKIIHHPQWQKKKKNEVCIKSNVDISNGLEECKYKSLEKE